MRVCDFIFIVMKKSTHSFTQFNTHTKHTKPVPKILDNDSLNLGARWLKLSVFKKTHILTPFYR